MTVIQNEPRETSGATTGGLLRYVRSIAGEEAVEQVLARACVRYSAEQLEDQADDVLARRHGADGPGRKAGRDRHRDR